MATSSSSSSSHSAPAQHQSLRDRTILDFTSKYMLRQHETPGWYPSASNIKYGSVPVSWGTIVPTKAWHLDVFGAGLCQGDGREAEWKPILRVWSDPQKSKAVSAQISLLFCQRQTEGEFMKEYPSSNWTFRIVYRMGQMLYMLLVPKQPHWLLDMLSPPRLPGPYRQRFEITRVDTISNMNIQLETVPLSTLMQTTPVTRDRKIEMFKAPVFVRPDGKGERHMVPMLMIHYEHSMFHLWTAGVLNASDISFRGNYPLEEGWEVWLARYCVNPGLSMQPMLDSELLHLQQHCLLVPRTPTQNQRIMALSFNQDSKSGVPSLLGNSNSQHEIPRRPLFIATFRESSPADTNLHPAAGPSRPRRGIREALIIRKLDLQLANMLYVSSWHL